MPINRKSVVHTLICIMLVIIAGALRAVLRNTAINYNGIVSLIYLAVCFQWILSIRKRFIASKMLIFSFQKKTFTVERFLCNENKVTGGKIVHIDVFFAF